MRNIYRLYHINSHIYHFWCSLYLCVLLSAVIFFQSEGFPLLYFIILLSFFAYIRVFLFHLHFGRIVLLGYRILDRRFFFLSALWIWHSTTFWPSLFQMRRQLLILLLFPCMWRVIFFLLLSSFSLVFGFKQFDYSVCCGSLCT